MHAPLNLEHCKFKVKKNGVTITLYKKSQLDTWTDIKPKKTLLNADRGDTSKNPQGDLMAMMKDMYQNGDDDMKRMISESW